MTQEQFAAELGVLSKGYISRLETGRQPWPLKLALRIEDLSDGAISATAIVEPEDARLLHGFAARAITRARLDPPTGRA